MREKYNIIYANDQCRFNADSNIIMWSSKVGFDDRNDATGFFIFRLQKDAWPYFIIRFI